MATSPRLVDVHWLSEHLQDDDVRVVDATVHLSFDENGAHTESAHGSYRGEHIPGAIFLDQLLDLSDPQAASAVHAGEQRTVRRGARQRRGRR